MLGLSVIILFNLIFNVNSNLAESSANCSEEKIHPYKIITSQQLKPADYPRRLQMCRYIATLTPC